MMKRPSRACITSLGTAGLEARSLRAAGLSAALSVVDDLGTVSPAAASAGVALSASIRPGTSITFVMTPQQAGSYELLVKYVGDPLTLEAAGPDGRAAITVGAPGSFTHLDLNLKAATYSITASDPDPHGSGTFVDWELILNTAVGQSPGLSASVVAPSATIPLPSLAQPQANPTPTAPTPSSPASVATTTPSATTPGLVISGPAGRVEPFESITPVGPVVQQDRLVMALANNGDLPTALSPEPPAEAIAARPVDLDQPMMTMQAEGDALVLDQQAIGKAGWLDRLVAAFDRPASTSTATLDEPADVPGPVDQASISPEMIAGVAVGGVILRQWRRHARTTPRFRTQPPSALARQWAPRSQANLG